MLQCVEYFLGFEILENIFCFQSVAAGMMVASDRESVLMFTTFQTFLTVLFAFVYVQWSIFAVLNMSFVSDLHQMGKF